MCRVSAGEDQDGSTHQPRFYVKILARRHGRRLTARVNVRDNESTGVGDGQTRLISQFVDRSSSAESTIEETDGFAAPRPIVKVVVKVANARGEMPKKTIRLRYGVPVELDMRMHSRADKKDASSLSLIAAAP